MLKNNISLYNNKELSWEGENESHSRRVAGERNRMKNRDEKYEVATAIMRGT